MLWQLFNIEVGTLNVFKPDLLSQKILAGSLIMISQNIRTYTLKLPVTHYQSSMIQNRNPKKTIPLHSASYNTKSLGYSWNRSGLLNVITCLKYFQRDLYQRTKSFEHYHPNILAWREAMIWWPPSKIISTSISPWTGLWIFCRWSPGILDQNTLYLVSTS